MARIEKVYQNDNVIEIDYGWYDYFNQNENLIVYIIIENMNVINVKEMKCYLENQNMFTRTSEDENMVLQIDIFDDENDISRHINNNNYTFNLTQIENYSINVTNCFGYLTMFDLKDDEIIRLDALVVILNNYGLLTYQTISIIINSKDITQFNDLIKDNLSNVPILDVYNDLITNIILLSIIKYVTQTLYAMLELESDDNDARNDISSDALTMAETESIIHLQIELVTDYITNVERKFKDEVDTVSVFNVLVEVIEESSEIKLINITYTYYYDSSFILYILKFVIEDIISVLQERVGQSISETKYL